jgi:hypothetical protein
MWAAGERGENHHHVVIETAGTQQDVEDVKLTKWRWRQVLLRLCFQFLWQNRNEKNILRLKISGNVCI